MLIDKLKVNLGQRTMLSFFNDLLVNDTMYRRQAYILENLANEIMALGVETEGTKPAGAFRGLSYVRPPQFDFSCQLNCENPEEQFSNASWIVLTHPG